MTAVNKYLAEYSRVKKTLAGHNLTWLNQLREQALEQLTKTDFPTFKDEDWKYTNVTPLTNRDFYWQSSVNKPNLNNLPGLLPAELNGHCLVFINGHYQASLSQINNLPKAVTITSLASVLNQQPELLELYLNKQSHKTAFNAINLGFINDGAFIHIPKNTILEQPIQLLFITTTTEQPVFSNLRNLVIAEENSQATIIESYVSMSTENHFNNIVSELILNSNSQLQHYKLIQENSSAFHIDTLYAKQHEHSKLTSYSFALNGNFARSDIHVELNSEYTECILNGLYLTRGKQHIDHHTVIDHAKPHTKSIENYKGILADKSRAVFNGKVIVRPGAQKTDAQQSNKNLLLSPDAEIDTKPQLEIYNDDVRCTHGAAVGQLDEASLFYLRSRGLNKEAARNVLILAFIKEILDKVPLQALKKQLETIILQSL